MVNLTTEGPLKMQILRQGWQAMGSFQVPTLILQSPECLEQVGTQITMLTFCILSNKISVFQGHMAHQLCFYQLIATVLKSKIGKK